MHGRDAQTGEVREIVDGVEIFKLMDAIGFPLDLAKESLRERGLSFDVAGFIRAARDSGNYSKERVVGLLSRDVSDPEVLRLVRGAADILYAE